MLVCWRFDQRQFDGGVNIQDGGDGFVDRAGLDFLDGGVYGGKNILLTEGMKEINCPSLFVVFVCFCEKSQGNGFWGFGLG